MAQKTAPSGKSAAFVGVEAFERMILEEYAPPCAVTNEQGDVIYLAGRPGRYLQVAAGLPSDNLFDLAQGALRVELRHVLAMAVRSRRKVVRNDVSVELDGVVQHLRLTVRPLPEPGLYAVVLQNMASDADVDAEPMAPDQSIIEQLDDELMTTRAQLHTVSSKLALMGGEDGVDRVLESNRDITARKEAEAALLESHRQINTILGSITDVFCSFDEQGRFVILNAAAEQMFSGQHGSELLGQVIWEVFPAVVGTSCHRHYIDATKNRTRQHFEAQSAIHGRWSEVFMFPRQGGIDVYQRDIDDRKKAEQALRDSEQRYAVICDQAPFAIVLSKLPEETIVSANDAFLRLFEYTREEVTGKTGVELHIVDAPSRALVGAELRKRGSLRDFECTRTTKSGAVRFVSISVDRVLVNGQEHALRTIQDITERRRAEDALRESERLYRAIGESIDYGVWVSEADGRNRYASESFLKLTGLTQQQCSDFGWCAVVHPQDVDRALAAWKECVRTGGVFNIENRVRGVDGQWHSVLVRGVPVKEQEGKVLFWAGMNLDISDLKRAEEALLEADRRKNEFIAVLSHELRNPLTPIRNSLNLLDRVDPGSEKAKHAQGVIARQTEQLARLVDDLLDVTRLSWGKLQVRPDRLDLRKLLLRAVDDHRSILSNAGLDLEVTVGERPFWVNGDAARLAQAIGNLLTNAAKFANRGGHVVVTLEQDGAMAVVRVSDDGVGMPPDLVARVFEPFEQADRTLNRSRGGLGLGLALVKGLVEQHGGQVQAYSAGLGKGSEFTIRLSLVEAPVAVEVAMTSPTARRILVIEDNVDAADTLRDLLEMSEHEVEVAYNGSDGLKKAREFRPEVVLCDIGLPEMDGYEVARAMRADDELRTVFLVALTGYGMPEDFARTREAGFDHHLTKPPNVKKLEELLKKWRS